MIVTAFLGYYVAQDGLNSTTTTRITNQKNEEFYTTNSNFFDRKDVTIHFMNSPNNSIVYLDNFDVTKDVCVTPKSMFTPINPQINIENFDPHMSVNVLVILIICLVIYVLFAKNNRNNKYFNICVSFIDYILFMRHFLYGIYRVYKEYYYYKSIKHDDLCYLVIILLNQMDIYLEKLKEACYSIVFLNKIINYLIHLNTYSMLIFYYLLFSKDIIILNKKVIIISTEYLKNRNNIRMKYLKNRNIIRMKYFKNRNGRKNYQKPLQRKCTTIKKGITFKNGRRNFSTSSRKAFITTLPCRSRSE